MTNTEPDRQALSKAARASKRRAGLKGGPARAKALSAEELSKQGKNAANARWKRPRKTHSGVLEVAGARLKCFVLDDGQRLFSKRGLARGIGYTDAVGGSRIADLIGTKALKSYISDSLRVGLTMPVSFNEGGKTITGIPARFLPQLCNAILAAWVDGNLNHQQRGIAKQCEVVLGAFGEVGVIALVDEATGYQHDRASDALAKILEQYVATELAQWCKTFPREYYQEVHRLHPKLDPRKMVGSKNPLWMGHITNNLIYDRIAPGLRDELNRKNPKNDAGRRPHAHHMWLTRQKGYPHLMCHIGRVIGMMGEFENWKAFLDRLDITTPKFPYSPQLNLFPGCTDDWTQND